MQRTVPWVAEPDTAALPLQIQTAPAWSQSPVMKQELSELPSTQHTGPPHEMPGEPDGLQDNGSPNSINTDVDPSEYAILLDALDTPPLNQQPGELTCPPDTPLPH